MGNEENKYGHGPKRLETQRGAARMCPLKPNETREVHILFTNLRPALRVFNMQAEKTKILFSSKTGKVLSAHEAHRGDGLGWLST